MVQLETDKKEKIVRKSRIKKGIERTINTAKYESIVIHSFIDEEIEWSTITERQRKTNDWLTVLITEFKRDYDRIMEELGMEEKKAFFKNGVEEKDYRPAAGVETELDNLDTL